VNSGSEALGLRETLSRDFEACMAMDHLRPRGLRRTFDVLTQSGFLTVVLFRVAHAAHLRGWFPVSRLLLLVMVALFSAEIYPQARIGPGFFIAHPMGVAIGAGTVIGSDVQVFKGVSIGTAGMRDPDRDGFPVIETGCKIFDGAKVFGPVTIGAHSRIGANVLLFNSVPACSTVSAPQGLVRNALTETSTEEGSQEVDATWVP
jgi:serine O-acetyltransferase